jgi:NAD(P)-dependent dehydrogenase (short-subunit alcohol dehydrogenase family)
MPNNINRRTFIAGASSVAVATTVSGCFNPDEQDVVRPDGVPVGPFDADSTAEEVTAGLDLTGKTAFITGCNSGLGYESMRVLTMRGATVIGAARNAEKAEQACASVEGKAIPVVCELSDLESVMNCGKTVQAMSTPIDMLILNAGIMALPELQQVNGLERQFFVNHIGHFALTSWLLDQVRAAPQGRVVSLSSSGHQFAPENGIDFDNLSGEKEYSPWGAYGVSKLANGLFVLKLSQMLAAEESKATANAVHPGIINTNLGRNFPWYTRLVAATFGWTFMKSIAEGAATQCYVATAPALADTSGYYFADCNPLLPDPRMLNQAQADQLWVASQDIAATHLGDWNRKPVETVVGV